MVCRSALMVLAFPGGREGGSLGRAFSLKTRDFASFAEPAPEAPCSARLPPPFPTPPPSKGHPRPRPPFSARSRERRAAFPRPLGRALPPSQSQARRTHRQLARRRSAGRRARSPRTGRRCPAATAEERPRPWPAAAEGAASTELEGAGGGRRAPGIQAASRARRRCRAAALAVPSWGRRLGGRERSWGRVEGEGGEAEFLGSPFPIPRKKRWRELPGWLGLRQSVFYPVSVCPCKTCGESRIALSGKASHT